jgi:hypothetical protein
VYRIFSRSLDTSSHSKESSSDHSPGSIRRSHLFNSGQGQSFHPSLDTESQPQKPAEAASSQSLSSINMKEEKKEELKFPPRGSIRDIGHTWDSDGNFPVHEIQRIKKKTKKLRSERASSESKSASSGKDFFRDTGFEDSDGLFQHVRHNNTNNASTGQSVRSKSRNTWAHGASQGSRDSLSDVLDRGSADTGITENPSGSSTSNNRQPPPQSQAAAKAQRRLLQDFHKPREVDSLDVSDPVTVDTSAESDDQNLTLHDLCGEAVSTDDIAWRNALCLLAKQPTLASVTDRSQLWAPLHICCLGMSPPPTYMVRALLYIYPKAGSLPDEGGRLPLHLVAASSADAEILQMLVEEFPAAVYQVDDHGLTPLHLLIRNCSVELTLEKAKILLGHTVRHTDASQQLTNKRHVLQRRGDHLNLSVNSVDQWLSSSKLRPVTNLNHNGMAHERHFDSYPVDVQVSLRKLAQWKNRQGPADESVEVQLAMDNDDDRVVETNPAAIPLPSGTQLPIHMLVQRAIIDEVTLDCSVVADNEEKERTRCDNDDDQEEDQEVASSEEESPSVPHAGSVLRLLAAACPEALVVRDANGMTPLLQVMQLQDSLPSLDIIEILLGKRAAGFEAMPPWASDLPVHSMKGTDRYVNPAMVPAAETGQLPLHLAAEEMSADYSLIQTIQESYPGAIHVQDARGRTPLHLALHSYRRVPADPRVVELLFSERVAQIVDDYGKLPFDLLVESAHGLPSHKPRSTSYGSEGSSVYQRLFNASIVGAARPDTPTKLSTFLRRLRNLPPWLRTEACATTYVQDLLTEELATPWKCALILLDGLLLVILITVFRLQMKEFVDQLESADILSSWYTYSVYATAIFRLFAQIIFGGLAVAIGEFQHLCMFNLWYWIDIWAMLLCIVTSVFLYSTTSDERLLVLGTASTILLWLSLIGYLSSWWYGMAIFTGGFSKVSSHSLSTPLRLYQVI